MPAPTMPDHVAQRVPAADFDQFAQLFEDCHADLRAGTRKLLPSKNPSGIEEGKFFVLNGVLLYVAEVGEHEFAKSNKGTNARTRCIFENGTESDLLVLSLARNLYKDGRRVTEPSEVTLQRMGPEPETGMGHIYNLRSLSEDPQLAGFGDVHKIGFTTQTVEHRIAGAEAAPPFLGATVKAVASYALPAVAAPPVEAILHSFFASARFAEKILAGEKSVELRRVRPSVAAAGTLVVFYASSPTCEVVGTGRIEAIEVDSPTALWERHRGELGLPRSEYRSYFAGVKQAVGILLGDIHPLAHRVPLAALRQRLGGFEPPQSFRYIDAIQAKAVI